MGSAGAVKGAWRWAENWRWVGWLLAAWICLQMTAYNWWALGAALLAFLSGMVLVRKLWQDEVAAERRLLDSLRERPNDWRDGLEIGKAAEVPAGLHYPLLARLENEGILESRWEAGERPRRRLYRLTLAAANTAKQTVQ